MSKGSDKPAKGCAKKTFPISTSLLVLHGHDDGSNVFTGITSDGQNNHSDESLAESRLLADLLNRSGKELGVNGNKHRDGGQDSNGCKCGEKRLLLLSVLVLLLLKQLRMCEELKVQVA